MFINIYIIIIIITIIVITYTDNATVNKLEETFVKNQHITGLSVREIVPSEIIL